MIDRTRHVIDVAIDDALEQLRTVRPAPDFVARVRAHVEATARPAFVLPSRLTVITAGAVAVVAIAAVSRVMLERPAVTVTVQQAAVLSRPDVNSPLHRDVTPSTPRTTAVKSTARRPPTRTAPAAGQAAEVSLEVPLEVLVPRGQREAVGRLFAAASAGQLEAVSVLRSVSVVRAADVAVPAIRIEPIVVPALAGIPESEP